MARITLSAIVFSTLALFALTAAAGDGGYNYISPLDLKEKIETGAPVTILDIQPAEEFSRHHIQGAISTEAYPVKTEAQRARLDAVHEKLAAGSDPVVIVCPRGGGGARRTFDHLVSRGMGAQRLIILEQGQGGWPYPELLAK